MGLRFILGPSATRGVRGNSGVAQIFFSSGLIMANLITLGRIILLFLTVGLLYQREPGAAAITIILIVLVYGGDALDGYVARRRGETTTAGAVVDTAGDRIVENVYWIVFAHLGVISIWIPLLMVTRSFSVDAMRTLALAQGRTTFGNTTMMESRLGLWLVASRLHRGLYGGTKLVAHCLLALQWGVQLARDEEVVAGRLPTWEAALPWITVTAQALAWFAVGYGVARGVLVLYDARHYLRNVPGGSQQ